MSESIEPTEVEWCLAYDLAMEMAGRTVPGDVVQNLYRNLSPEMRESVLAPCLEILATDAAAPDPGWKFAPRHTPLADAWFAKERAAGAGGIDEPPTEEAEPKHAPYTPDPGEPEDKARLRWAQETGDVSVEPGRMERRPEKPRPSAPPSPEPPATTPAVALLQDELPAGFLETLTGPQKTVLFELRVYPEEWPASRVKQWSKGIADLAQQLTVFRARQVRHDD